MGNCISKINKDYFFAFEEEMKNDILFFKEKTSCVIEMCARGKKIYRNSFHKELFRKVCSITKWNVVEKLFYFFKNELIPWAESNLSVLFCWTLGPH